jgi:aspartate aminotransferase-like enzyme
MSKTRYLVEIATLHGPTRQRRWRLAHIGQDKAACHAYIERVIADLPTEREARRSFGLTRERAREFYRVRGVRV